MKLSFDLDSDPSGSGKRARTWAIIMVWSTIILAEITIISFILLAIVTFYKV